MNRKGFSPIVIILIIAAILVIGGIVFIYIHQPHGYLPGGSTASAMPDTNLGVAEGGQSINGIMVNFKLPSQTFGLAIASTTQWLNNQRLEAGYSHANDAMMYFNGTVSQLENSFHVQIYQYRVRGNIC